MLEGERLWTGWATDNIHYKEKCSALYWMKNWSVNNWALNFEREEQIKIYDTIFFHRDENWVKSERWNCNWGQSEVLLLKSWHDDKRVIFIINQSGC